MIEFQIPGYGTLQLDNLVLDYNGTLALDGTLIQGVKDRLNRLSGMVSVWVVTADTFGTVRDSLERLDVRVQVLHGDGTQSQQKAEIVRDLGPVSTAAIGNGRNDGLMLQTAGLAIAVIGHEGASPDTVSSADIVTTDIRDALDLLLVPGRLKATLRR